ncbi:thiol-disulfide isomerase-like thioredoxin [Singulisphaera acidiphila DSM 18658]|uniref:Thiol-disulfide isomerase-like thioredoxin n=1 Tax=Singulisphaera acidiphila (strain ATCC BAA-1392 / DSM 18658 / VKM B-2454 / MOB10) TaxID=886293 RepID=L0DL32_SINAD|nr:thiol-disulfide isomerase-like thioredoxin [Singulisphaera acidiphila DSM 18658]
MEVRARDEAGLPIKDFEIQLYGPPNTSPEAFGVDGLAVLTDSELKTWNHGDLIVSAPGFASTIREFGPVNELRKLDVPLKRGTKVRLRVRDWVGKPIPPTLMPLPQVYLLRHRKDAWFSFALGDPETRADTVERTNFLKVHREDDGDFAFHIPTDQTEPLYFGFSHPDVLRYFEKGPVPASDLTGGVWDVVLPQPATLDASLKASRGAGEKTPFASGRYHLSQIIPEQTDSGPILETGTLKDPEWRSTIPRLAPGAYNFYIQTTPSEGMNTRLNLEAQVGEFRDQRKLDLKPGEHATLTLDPPPFNPDAWRGKLSATVIVNPAGDRTLKDEEYRVSYILPNYGYLPVAKGMLGSEGKIVLENLAPSGSNPFGGQYTVDVAGEPLGHFNLKDKPERQEFPFRIPLQSGDLAADSEVQDLETSKPVRISDFRGRVVFLEFWATWCGPCREPRQKLDALGKRHGKDWGNDVALIAIGTDNDREVLRRHVQQNGLTNIRNFWSPQDHPEQASSAYAAYSISRVPTAFLIGRDGRILWRGHPQSLEVESKIEELLAQDR